MHQIVAHAPERRQPLPARLERAAARNAVALALGQQVALDALQAAHNKNSINISRNKKKSIALIGRCRKTKNLVENVTKKFPFKELISLSILN